MENVRIGILGNSFASTVQLPALKSAGGNRVVGIAGARRAKAEATAAEWNIELATDDYREVLALEPDLVIISTPVHLHRQMVLDTLDTPAAILCEKPMAMNVAEAQEMLARAEGRACWLDHQLRWSPLRRALRSELARGKIGDLWHVQMDFSIPVMGIAERPYRWWYDVERGGGILGAIGSHMIDILRHELGEISAIRAQLDILVPERTDADGVRHRVTAEEHATIALRFASGLRADLVTTLAVREGRTFYTRYVGSQGTLVLDEEERLLFGDAEAEELAPLEGVPELPTAESAGMTDYGPLARALPAFLTDLLQAVRSGRELADAATFADGLAVQLALDAARASHDSGGGWIDIAR